MTYQTGDKVKVKSVRYERALSDEGVIKNFRRIAEESFYLVEFEIKDGWIICPISPENIEYRIIDLF